MWTRPLGVSAANQLEMTTQEVGVGSVATIDPSAAKRRNDVRPRIISYKTAFHKMSVLAITDIDTQQGPKAHRAAQRRWQVRARLRNLSPG